MKFKEEWLIPGAVVPVDAETTRLLVEEIKRVVGVVGGMALQKQAPINKSNATKLASKAGFSEAWLSAGKNPPDFEAPAVLVERFATLVEGDFKERLAQAIEQMPFGDTAQSFAQFVREFK